MQIIISMLILGLLWMIYDVINAPAVDEDENQISDIITDQAEDPANASKENIAAPILKDSQVEKLK